MRANPKHNQVDPDLSQYTRLENAILTRNIEIVAQTLWRRLHTAREVGPKVKYRMAPTSELLDQGAFARASVMDASMDTYFLVKQVVGQSLYDDIKFSKKEEPDDIFLKRQVAETERVKPRNDRVSGQRLLAVSALGREFVGAQRDDAATQPQGDAMVHDLRELVRDRKQAGYDLAELRPVEIDEIKASRIAPLELPRQKGVWVEHMPAAGYRPRDPASRVVVKAHALEIKPQPEPPSLLALYAREKLRELHRLMASKRVK